MSSSVGQLWYWKLNIFLSLMEIYPEFPVANLNYAGGHTGHQILILVAQNEIWSPRPPF